MEYPAPSTPPIGMRPDESAALPTRMRGAVSTALPPWLRGAVLLSGGKMPEESVSPPPPPPPTDEFQIPIQMPAAEEAAAVAPFPVKMAGGGSASSAPLPWMHGLPVKTAAEKKAAAAAAVPEEASQAIADMAARLGIAESARKRAMEVFMKMEERKGKAHHYYTKGGGRSGDTLYAACLYVACRHEGAPRTFKELAAATRDGAAARKDIGKLITLIRKRLEDEVGGQAMEMGVVRAADYMERFGSVLGMEEPEVRAAQEAARRMQERLDVRRNPDSTAAAIIYMTIGRLARVPKSFRDVSLASGVAEGTIKQAYRELYPHAELLFG